MFSGFLVRFSEFWIELRTRFPCLVAETTRVGFVLVLCCLSPRYSIAVLINGLSFVNQVRAPSQEHPELREVQRRR